MKSKLWILISIIVIIIIVILILCFNRVIPKLIGKHTAIQYVSQKYPYMNLEFKEIEFPPSYGNYIVTFSDSNGKIYNFKLSPNFFRPLCHMIVLNSPL